MRGVSLQSKSHGGGWGEGSLIAIKVTWWWVGYGESHCNQSHMAVGGVRGVSLQSKSHGGGWGEGSLIAIKVTCGGWGEGSLITINITWRWVIDPINWIDPTNCY